MKNKLSFRRSSLLLLPLLLWAAGALAQANPDAAPEMADVLRQNGKIYVVVTAVAIIVAGLLLYLISLDRKVSRLEKELPR